MAGDGIAYRWDDEELQELIKSSIGRVEDMTPVMKSFSEYMVTRTDDRFKAEEAPDGSGWQALAPVTVARKERLHKIDKILQQDGYLRLVHPIADKQSAGVYSNRVYAAIHNRGGMAGHGLSVKIPKREFLGFNDDDFREFRDTVTDYILLGRS